MFVDDITQAKLRMAHRVGPELVGEWLRIWRRDIRQWDRTYWTLTIALAFFTLVCVAIAIKHDFQLDFGAWLLMYLVIGCLYQAYSDHLKKLSRLVPRNHK